MFDTRADGARVPDLYSVPTIVSKIHKQFTVQTSSEGRFSFLFMPNLHASVTMDVGTSSDLATWTQPDGVTRANSLLSFNDGVKTRLRNYRIVGMGLRVRDIASMTNVSGLVHLAALPIKSRCPTDLGFSSSAEGYDHLETVYAAYGVPSTGTTTNAVIDQSSLPQYPQYKSYSGLLLANAPVEVVPKICDPSCFDFKMTDFNKFGLDPAISGGSTDLTADTTVAMLGGFQTCIVAGSGFPASTGVLNVEVVYHLEGSPIVTGSSSGVQFGVGEAHCAHTSFTNAVDAASRAPIFRKVSGG